MMDIRRQYKVISILGLLLLTILIRATGQSLPGAIKEGQAVPPEQIIFTGDNGSQLHFKDLKGKLIILDFWNVWCSACISNMPYMDSLQVKFGDKICIIMVTGNSKEQADKLFNRIGKRAPHLLGITGDTILSRFFPHYGEPHHVWIDPEGVYQYASFDHNTTEKNIEAFLTKKALDLTLKTDGKFQEDSSLLAQDRHVFSPLISRYSIFMKDLSGYTVGGGTGAFRYDEVHHWPCFYRAVNVSPIALLQAAFDTEIYGYEVGILNMKKNKRMLIEVSDPSSLYQPLKYDLIDQWRKANMFSYEISILPKSADDLFEIMQADLNRAMPIKGSVEIREVNAWLITTKVPIVKNGKAAGKTEFGKGMVHFNQVSIKELLRQANYVNVSPLPFINGGATDFTINLSISWNDLIDPAKLKQRLQGAGLEMHEAKTKIKMLVIRDSG